MISRREVLLAVGATLRPAMVRARQAPSVPELLFDPPLPVSGNPQGDVLIAEFFNYARPNCKVLHPHLKRILEEDGGIRPVMKNWPINGDLVGSASRMVLAVDRLGHYAPAHAAVMEITVPLSHGRIDNAMRDRGVDEAEVRDAGHPFGSVDALLLSN